MNMLARAAALVLSALVALAPVAASADQPIYRFKLGASSPAPGGGNNPGGGNPGETENPGQTDPLAFGVVGSLPSSMTVGQSASASVTGTGGGALVHTLTATGLPTGMAVSRLGDRSWAVGGTATAAGTFGPVLTLTDGTATLTRSLGTVVVGAAGGGGGQLAVRPYTSGADSYGIPPYLQVGEDVENLDEPIYYAVSGGTEPYSLTMVGGPDGVFAEDLGVSVPGQGRIFVLKGVPASVADFPNLRFVATDSSAKDGQATSRTTVLDGPFPLYFKTVFDPTKTSVLTGERVTGFYVAAGGTGPYTLELVDVPQQSHVEGDDYQFSLEAAFDEPGTISGAKVRLRDSAGATVEHALPTMTVGLPESIHFTRTSNLPSVVYRTQQYGLNDSLPIRIAGFGTKRKDVEIVPGTAPEGFSIDPIDQQGNYALSGSPTSFGTFPAVRVRAYTLTGNWGSPVDREVFYTMSVTVRSSASTGPSETAPDLDFASVGDIPESVERGTAITASFTASGGEGTYSMSATGLPTGLTFGQVSGTTWAVSGTATQVGTFNPRITLTSSGVDHGDGQGTQGAGSVEHDAGPTTVWAGAGQLRITPYFWGIPVALSVGESIDYWEVHWGVSGGQPPYQVEIADGPSGFRAERSSLGEGSESYWVFYAKGVATPAGHYPVVRFRATDALGNEAFYGPGVALDVQ